MHDHHWTFLSNHAHVLVSLLGDSEQTLREVADSVGITERAVQRILGDLEAAGIVRRYKEGRTNRYEFDLQQPMRHPLESHVRIAEISELIIGRQR